MRAISRLMGPRVLCTGRGPWTASRSPSGTATRSTRGRLMPERMYQLRAARACDESVVGVAGVEERSSERESQSFDSFYRAEYAAIVRLAYALTGRREVAEELAQDAFLACHRRWETVSRYDNPGTWVRRVVTNVCMSSGRRHATELRLLARLHRERLLAPELSDRSEQLWSIVRGLPKRQAQTLALAFVDDLTVAAIAATLGIGEESVRTHLRRGRDAVAAKLRELSADD